MGQDLNEFCMLSEQTDARKQIDKLANEEDGPGCADNQ